MWPPPSPRLIDPPTGRAFPTRPTPTDDPHPTFPLSVAIGTVLTLAVSLIVSRVVLNAIVDQRWPIAVYVALSAAIGYGPVLTWCVLATRRHSDEPWRDRLGLHFLRADLGWAPLTWIATFGVQMVVAIVIYATRIPITSNTEGLDDANRTYVLCLLVLAVVAAPFAEEIAFRAVVLRGLLSCVGPVVAIGVQAVLFGMAHFDPVRGVGNIGLVMVTGAIGASFGAVAYWFRRIGTTIAAHAIINAVALTIVLSGALDNVGS